MSRRRALRGASSRLLALALTASLAAGAAVALAPSASANGNCTTYFAGHGTGTPSDPYLVAAQLDLEEVSFCRSASFLQTANIALSGSWIPLGSSVSPFTGTYDGGGYSLSGLSISAAVTDNVGLFGYTSGALITAVRITSGSVVGQDNVGAIAGTASNSAVTNSYSAASVSGRNQVGGLIGVFTWSSGARKSVSQSYSSGAVTASSNYVGGLIGTTYGVEVTDSYATGAVTGNLQVGGVIGENASSALNRVYATGLVTDSVASNAVGGLMGQQSSGTYSGDTWDIQTTGQANSDFASVVTPGSTTAEMRSLSTFTALGWNISSTWNASSPTTWIQCTSFNDGYPFLSTFVSAGTSPCPDGSGSDLTTWHLSVGRPTMASACPSGYSASWAQWPHGGTGGWVCNRWVYAYRPLTQQ